VSDSDSSSGGSDSSDSDNNDAENREQQNNAARNAQRVKFMLNNRKIRKQQKMEERKKNNNKTSSKIQNVIPHTETISRDAAARETMRVHQELLKSGVPTWKRKRDEYLRRKKAEKEGQEMTSLDQIQLQEKSDDDDLDSGAIGRLFQEIQERRNNVSGSSIV
jgi:hypothetical protein